MKLSLSLYATKVAKYMPKTTKIYAVRLYHDLGLLVLCENALPAIVDRWKKSKARRSYTLKLRNGLNIDIELGTFDAQTIAEIFWERVYTPSFLEDYFRDPTIICDIGANIGIFSLFAAKRFDKAKIYSYEPDPVIFKALTENIRKNNLEGRIAPYNVAVGPETGSVLFLPSHTHNKGAGKIVNDASMHSYHGAMMEVGCVSLEDIIKAHSSIDLLKIDIEGGEYELLLKTSPDVLSRVKYIAMEWHVVPGYQISQIEKKLKNNGFNVLIHRSMLYAYR